MKTIIKWRFIIALMICLTGVCQISISGNPPDLPAGHGSNSDHNPPGGGAYLESGWLMLITLSGIYVGKKIYELNKTEEAIR